MIYLKALVESITYAFKKKSRQKSFLVYKTNNSFDDRFKKKRKCYAKKLIFQHFIIK